MVVGIVSSYFYAQLNKVKKVDIPKANSELNTSDNAAKQDDKITNIGFLGVDRRNKDEPSRLDVFMILNLDKKIKR